MHILIRVGCGFQILICSDEALGKPGFLNVVDVVTPAEVIQYYDPTEVVGS